MIKRRNARKGFTLIELLIVVAIIGVIAAILIPNLLDSLQKSKQKRTMGDMKAAGTCWFSWLTDQVGAAAAGSGGRSYDLSTMTLLTSDELLQTLYVNSNFFYCQEIPERDNWGSDTEYYYGGDPLASQVMAIRSSGSDASFESTDYAIGPYIGTNYAKDIVWADGFFVSYPAGKNAIN